jgi:hypothetical protein
MDPHSLRPPVRCRRGREREQWWWKVGAATLRAREWREDERTVPHGSAYVEMDGKSTYGHACNRCHLGGRLHPPGVLASIKYVLYSIRRFGRFLLFPSLLHYFLLCTSYLDSTSVMTWVRYNLGSQFWSPTKLLDEPCRRLDTAETVNTLLFYLTRQLAIRKSEASTTVKPSHWKMCLIGSDC